MSKNFLLGLGAMKCGTSWLHNYLAKHPQVNMGFMKEYHVFDTLFLRDTVKRAQHELANLQDIATSGKIHSHTAKKVLPRLAMAGNLDLYTAYFKSLATAESIRLVGDITPGYNSLSASSVRAST